MEINKQQQIKSAEEDIQSRIGRQFSKFIFNLQHNNRLITYDTNKMQDVAELEDEFSDEPITQNGKK